MQLNLIYSDPDCVVLCVLATDEEDLDDIALQIHFTLLQAFCCDNDINILRVSGLRRLAQVLGEPSTVDNSEPRDFHCILVTVSRLRIRLTYASCSSSYILMSLTYIRLILCVFTELSMPTTQMPGAEGRGQLL